MLLKAKRHVAYLLQKTVGGNANYVKRRPCVVVSGTGPVNLRVRHIGETYNAVAVRTDVNDNATGTCVTY
jgi:hypothetical protein